MAPDQVNDQLLTKNGVPWYAKWIDMEFGNSIPKNAVLHILRKGCVFFFWTELVWHAMILAISKKIVTVHVQWGMWNHTQIFTNQIT